MKFANDELLTASVTLDDDYNSPAILLATAEMYAVQLVFTGTPNGAFKLQASNDFGDPANPVESARASGVTNWTDLSGTSTNVSAAGSLMFTVDKAPYRWVRVVFTHSSSTGSLTSIRFNSKSIF